MFTRKSQSLYSMLIAGVVLSSSLILPFEEGTASAAAPSYISVQNNVGMADSVTFDGTVAKDVVKVYNSAGTILLGSATATKAGNLKVTLKEQFSEETVKVSLTHVNSKESAKVEVDVPEEVVTDVPDEANLTVFNNVGMADTVVLKGAKRKDTLKVYSDDGSELLGSAVASKDGDLKVVLAEQFSSETVQVSVSNYNSLESDVVELIVEDELITDTPSNSSFTVHNNVGMADKVVFKEAWAKAVVNVYDDTGVDLIASAKASKSGDLTVTLPEQISTETLQVSLTNYNSNESEKITLTVEEELLTETPDSTNFTVYNNVGTADKVVYKNVKKKDTVKLYDAAGLELLGVASASKDGDLVVTLNQQIEEDTLQATLTHYNSIESEMVELAVEEEAVTSNPDETDFTVFNNVGTSDKVVFLNAKKKDIVKVYNASGKILLGTDTASKDGEMTVTLAKQLVSGTVKVSVTNFNSNESEKIDLTVEAEKVTDTPDEESFTVFNNVRSADKIVFKGAKRKDVVKVYNATGKVLLGSATASKDGDLTVTLAKQLTTGTVKVSVTNINSKESEKTALVVEDEQVTDAPDSESFTVYNNSGSQDKIVYAGAKRKDVVKIYNASGKIILGTATASKDGSLTIKLAKQLTGSTVLVSLTSYNAKESEKVALDIPNELETELP